MSLIIARRRLAGVLVAAAAVLAPACGDDAAEESPDAEGLAAAGRDFWADFVAGDVDGMYDRLTAECREQVSRAEFGAQISLASTFAEAFGLDLAEAEITGVETNDVADGRGELLVELEVDGEPLDEEAVYEPWVHEQGWWRTEECDDEDFFGEGDSDGAGDGDGSEGDDASATTVGGDLVPADEAIESEARVAAVRGLVGEPAPLGDLTVVVESVRASAELPEGGDAAVLDVEVRVENRSGELGQVPLVELTCSSTGVVTQTGFYSGATLDSFGDVPSGSFQEGLEVLGVPEGCDDPRIRVSEAFDDAAVDYGVPADALS